jgi:hypothetical protein
MEVQSFWPNDVCNELLERNEKASAMRMGGAWNDSVDPSNTRFLKEVVQQYGWPKKSEVGDEVATAAWLVIQHTGDDLAFQKECLELLRQAVGNGEASPEHVAYLHDRILIIEKKPQIYGTQLTIKDGAFVSFPIEDEDTVDERRKKLGLASLSSYIIMMNECLK